MLARYSRRSYGITLLLAAVVTLGVGLVNAIYAQETTYDASFGSCLLYTSPSPRDTR